MKTIYYLNEKEKLMLMFPFAYPQQAHDRIKGYYVAPFKEPAESEYTLAQIETDSNWRTYSSAELSMLRNKILVEITQKTAASPIVHGNANSFAAEM